MNLADLNKVALAMVASGKGILAADESTGTIKKRFDAINVASTEETRRDYREMLFRSSEAMSKYISGVILYDETIWQDGKDCLLYTSDAADEEDSVDLGGRRII